MTHPLPRVAQLTGAIFGLIGVALGAFAAHALKAHLAGLNTTEVWKTAVFYQDVHAVALLAASSSLALRRGIVWCWTLGVVFFSGSLYLLAYDPTWSWLGPVTPLGGLLLMIGWGWLIVTLLRTP
jgi:uncharacterized membrane protein YgdD (TMEM256/DUF423 family)